MVPPELNDSDARIPRRALWRTWYLCVVGFSILYLLTCQRGVSWQDSGMFQWRVLTGDYTGQRGLALAHPLYIAVAELLKHIPAGTLSGRLNFFSGLGMAVALGNLAVVISLLTGRRWTGLLVAAMLSVTHTAWWLSTVAEVYTWSIAGLTAELWLLVLLLRGGTWRTLTGLALVSGLGLGVHNFALLPLPVYLAVTVVLIARRRLAAWALGPAAIAWLAGASTYLGFVVNQAVVSGDAGAAIQSALFGGQYAADVLNATRVSRNFRANMALSGINLISMLVPLAVVGWVTMGRRLGRPLAAALGAVTIVEILFFIRYPVADQFTFILPTLVMISISAGVGLAAVADVSKRARTVAAALCVASVFIQPAVCAMGPAMLRTAGITIRRDRQLPFRDETRYWLVPWKHNEDSAQRFAVSALRQGRNGVILTDSTSHYPLLVTRDATGEFQDVWIPDSHRPLPNYEDDPRGYRAALSGRPLYIVSPVQEGLSPKLLGDTEPVACPQDSPVLYRLNWKGSVTTAPGP